MGTDTYTTLGRFKNKHILTNQNRAISDSTGVVVSDFFSNVRPEDFELQNVPAEIDIDRNYNLFSWLANRRGDLKPIAGLEVREEQTERFIKWIAAFYQGQGRVAHEEFYNKCNNLDIGNGHVLYMVKQLASFNYDQVPLIYDPNDDGQLCKKTGDWIYNHIPEQNGKFYRELFDDSYFQLLEYCQKEGWDFIIFCFDC